MHGLRGAAIEVDVQFFGSLDAICACATESGVEILVTHALRTPRAPAAGLIPRLRAAVGGRLGSGAQPVRTVNTPVPYSNHEAGHAIDVNIWHVGESGAWTTCDSACLSGELGALPEPVVRFNRCLRARGLRCCGDVRDGANQPDYVHIDDGLNVACGAHEAVCAEPDSRGQVGCARYADRRFVARHAATAVNGGLCPDRYLQRRLAVQSSGACPPGQWCDPASGRCERDTTAW